MKFVGIEKKKKKNRIIKFVSTSINRYTLLKKKKNTNNKTVLDCNQNIKIKNIDFVTEICDV